MQQLLSNEWYRNHINGEQEVMIGYSDSGKDAGRMAAAWGLYEVQESLVRVAAVCITVTDIVATDVPGTCDALSCPVFHGIVCIRTGVWRQAYPVPRTRRHCRTWWRPDPSCHPVAAAKHGQWQHQSHCAGMSAPLQYARTA